MSSASRLFEKDDYNYFINTAATLRDELDQTYSTEEETGERYQLSFSQEHIWFLCQFLPSSSFYNIPLALDMKGTLSLAQFERSLNKIIERHEPLHTLFCATPNGPMQEIAPVRPLYFPLIDLSGLSAQEQLDRVRELNMACTHTIFDLSHDLLMRARLLRLDHERHVLLLTVHHLAFDGWSGKLLLQELGILYTAYLQRKLAPLPLLTQHYKACVIEQHRLLASENWQAQLSYWQERLKHITPLHLPADYPRSAEPGYKGDIVHWTFSSQLLVPMTQFCQENHITLFTLLVASFQLLLARYTDQNDIAIGTLVANRNNAAFEQLIGCFTNILVLRSHIPMGMSFVTFVQQVRQMLLEAFSFKDVPYEKVVEAVKPERTLSNFPLFQVMLVSQGKQSISDFGGLTIEILEDEKNDTLHDLYISTVENEDTIQCAVSYNANLFERSTILHFMEHWQVLLQSVITDPSNALAHFPLLTEGERQQVLVDWNRTSQPMPDGTTFLSLFAEQIQRSPDAIAVICEDKVLTYAALDHYTNQLARYLCSLEVGPETLVGVYMERSIEMLIAILAIFKAGAAYVPLDPAYPTERLAYIIEHAHVPVLLTQPELASAVPARSALCIPLQTGMQICADFSGEALSTEIDEDNLAYVIYTSGSTGTPKGAMIQHRGMLNHLLAKVHDLAIGPGERVAQTASHCFDISVWQFLAALLKGAQVHIIPDEIVHMPRLLMQATSQQQISILEIVPALLRAVLQEEENQLHDDADEPDYTRHLRWLIATGEALPTELCKWWLQRHPQTAIMNAYGPTECSDDVTHQVITEAPVTPGASIPIGSAIENTELYILDTYLAPVPVGVAGQLYVGGKGVGRGYFNDPVRTASSFIPNLFSSQAGTRLYQTGDLARYLPSGAIEFLGRIDHQIKLRGFRIEPGEIEHVLLEHPDVQNCLVVVHEPPSGQKQLVAYLVPEEYTIPSVQECQGFLRQYIPDYMIPATFIVLDALPLTPNGKIDRLALPVPEVQREHSRVASIAPRNDIEELLAHIWKDLLGLQHISVASNFFELGGHSLLATQLLSRVQAAFHVSLPLREFFEAATIELLARQIEIALQGNEHVQFKPITARQRPSALPLSFAQERLWFLHQLNPENYNYNLATMLQMSGDLNINVLEKSLREIIRRQESLRTTFEIADGQPVQVIHATNDLAFPGIDLSGLASSVQMQVIEQLAAQAAMHPFNLASGPLMRTYLVRLSSQEYRLIIIVHHIVFDGWSLHIFLDELSNIYASFLDNSLSPIDPLPLQYADFALWQRQWLADEATDLHLRYWKQQLANQPEVLALQTDRPRPPEQTFYGSSVPITIPVELTTKLHLLSRTAETTLFMTLLAALQTLLYRYTYQEDIVVGTVVAARNHREIENLIGFFVNTLVMRTSMAGNPSFLTVLKRVREVCLGAYAHQDIPFEQVVDAVQPQRDLSISPLFQVMFVLQNAPTIDLDIPGVTVRSQPIDTHSSKFDLTVSLSDTSEGLVGTFEYNSDLFDRVTIQRYVEHFLLLLTGIVSQPEQKISAYTLLTQQETLRLLTTWNADQAPDEAVSVSQLFEAQAEARPDSIALVAGEQHLTYAELNQRANRLAHYLHRIGIDPGMPIGVYTERSLEMIIAMLGILKAGAAYVPLDPQYPQERISFLIADAQIDLLLTQNHLLDQIASSNLITVALDSEWSEIAAQAPENLPLSRPMKQLVYIIYTSGSTGKPKGVEIEQQGLLNLVRWHQRAFALSPEDRTTHVAGLGFDASTWEIWPTLASGASLYLGDEETRLSPVLLRDWFIACGITVSFLPTPLAEIILTLDWPEKGALRYLLTGGDALRSYPPSTLPFKLINNYGPTENTVVATSGHIPSQAMAGILPSIGRQITNTQTYVLDRFLQIVPIGLPGELYIGGTGVARGYVHLPELTAERFVPDPFSGRPGARLYKTGDQVRYRENGQLEFLGRIDNQVKIRGYRIELEEIEQTLIRIPGIQNAAVLAREDTPGEKRLVAYIVFTNQSGLTNSDLRSYLRTYLPEYMIPAYFLPCLSLPLTANGKVDRQALPAPDYAHLNLELEHVSPHTPLERTLAMIWQQVLGLEEIGIHDNFFALGGDSILSIKIVALMLQSGWQLSPKLLFQYQTIAELASVAVPIQKRLVEPAMVTGEYALSPIQRRFFEQEATYREHWNQSQMLLVKRPLKFGMLLQVLSEIIQHHDILRTRFIYQTDALPQAIITEWKDSSSVPLVFVDLSDVPATEQTEIIEKIATSTQQSLNTEEGALLRVVYFALGKFAAARILIVAHHLVIDNVSWRIILEDLQSAYGQLIDQWELGQQDISINLPAKTTSYQQWTQELVQYAQQPALLEEVPFWLEQVQQQVPALPVDYTHGANTIDSSECIESALSSELTQALLYQVPPVYRTQMNDVLITALLLTLNEWTRSKGQLLHLEGHGREEILAGLDLSGTIGWFTSIYPIFFDLENTETTGAQLKRVKELLRAIPQRGIGYGLLRYLCQVPEFSEALATLKAGPEAEISFNYQGQLDQVFPADAPFSLAPEKAGAPVHPQARRHHLFEVDCNIKEGQLHVYWVYSRNYHHRETIQQLVEHFLENLREIIAHCLSPQAGGYTPSDFPLAALSQSQIDRLLGSDRLVETVYPLSPLQHGLLFLTLYAPGNGDYTIQARITVQGPFSIDALIKAWEKAIERHTALRTNFRWEDVPEPLQIVHTTTHLPVDAVDWSESSTEEQDAQLAMFLKSDRQRGFQIDKEPLQRLKIIRLGEESYTIIWSYHHLILDGWSCPIVLRDILSYYDACMRSENLILPASPPYHHYIAWLKQQSLSAAEAFWRANLRGFTEPTPLNFGRSSFSQQPAYAEQTLLLSNQATHILQNFARQQHITINTLFQCAWALLLKSYNGREDIVFGTVVSGRPAELSGVETMVGLFINTLPMRIHLPADLLLSELLQQVQTHLTELRQYEYTPLVEIQKWSELSQGATLLESLLVFENYPSGDLASQAGQSTAPSQVFKNFTVKEQTNYPLTLMIVPGQKLRMTALYDQNRFSEQTLEQVLAHLSFLLETLPLYLNEKLSQIPLLPPVVYQKLIESSGEASFPVERTLHKMFAEQVKARPDAIALILQDHHISYSELNRRANRIAHRLHRTGIGAEMRVGLCVERSLELLVGILGILKAGAIYVPVDPANPVERSLFILEDAQVAALLTQEKIAAQLPVQDLPVFYLDRDLTDELSPDADDEDLSEQGIPDNAAYIIYTSGSTGKPKGVVVTHKNVVRLMASTQAGFAFDQHDTWTLFHSYAFDFSVWEIWGALLYGGRLVIVPYWVSRTPEDFYRLLQNEAVTVLNQTPSAFYRLIETEAAELHEAKAELALRLVIFGGEALELRSLHPWVLRHGDQHPQLVNMYGITETTVHVTYHQLTATEIAQANGSVIGNSLSDLQLYLLHPDMSPVPIEAPGELYVGGAGVARGYWGNPALTAERFMPNPFSSQPGSRLYKTGDLARRLHNNDLEYLGRIDHQVKIRGFRIELGEIEAAILSHPAVRECVVKVHEAGPSSKRLAAYVVIDKQSQLSKNDLHQFLQQSLPDYMIPPTLITLDAFPLTENGKVDHRRLEAPVVENEQNATFLEPRTYIEKTLVAIWSEVLGLKQISMSDNFFALGGDSILSIQIVSRARQAGLQLTPRQLFLSSTIEQLSLEVELAQPDLLNQEPVSGSLPLTPVQHWFFAQEQPVPQHWNQSFQLEVPQKLCWESFQQAWSAIHNQHDALRLRFWQQQDGSWQQHYAESGTTAPFSWIDLSLLSSREQSTAMISIEADAQASLNLSTGPLSRAIFFQTTRQETGSLLVIIHHLVIDGVSWRILFEDLQTAYTLYTQQLPVYLPAKTTSYKKWAEQLCEYALSSDLQQEIPYWLQYANRPVPALPTDFSGTPEQNREETARIVFSTLPVDETRTLLEQTHRLYDVQFQEALIAALTQTFTTWTQSSSFLLDMEGHGREEIFDGVDVSRTVGWFTSIFPVYLQLGQESQTTEILTTIKQQMRSIPQRGLGYGILYYLSQDPAIREQFHALPQSDVLFNYFGQIDQMLPSSQMFGALQASSGPTAHQQGKRSHLFHINCWIASGQLHISWAYSEKVHQASTIEQLMDSFLQALHRYAEDCQLAGNSRSYIVADFPDADLNQEQLEQILSIMNEEIGD